MSYSDLSQQHKFILNNKTWVFQNRQELYNIYCIFNNYCTKNKFLDHEYKFQDFINFCLFFSSKSKDEFR